ncbi:hypothetical protein DIPPA_09061 [Diplonema papillatum]|nr:hypothetical protein DIPPA_09061 [Diplonema papillatum]
MECCYDRRKSYEAGAEHWIPNACDRLEKNARGFAEHLPEGSAWAAFEGKTANSQVPLASYAATLLAAARYFGVDTPANVLRVALILIDRLPAGSVTAYTVHRVFLVSFVIAMKVVADTMMTNRQVALYGGVPLQTLNRLEIRYLAAVGFENIAVSDAAYRLKVDEFHHAAPAC